MTKYAWMTSAAVVGLLFSAAGIAASSQPYPSRPVRLLIGYAPGGSDIPGRMLAQRLAEKFGQPFVIDNRPGAASILATDLLSKAPPDGYTLIFSTAAHAVTAVYYQKLPYDPIRDFTPVSRVGVPGVVAGTWYGINAPRRTPQAIVERLNREIVGILEMPTFREQFAAVGVVPEPSTPQEFGAFIRSEIEKWSGVMKFAGMKQEAY